MKKFLILFFSIFCLWNIAAAEDDVIAGEYLVGDYRIYINPFGEISINSYIGTEINVVVPSEIEGFPVVEISGTFKNNKNIESVTLPNSIQRMYSSPFYGCTKLKKVVLPEGIKSIIDDCFYNCSNLEEIVIPASVVEIGSSAFYNCKNLKSIELPEGLTYINSNAFAYCKSLVSIVIPDGVTTLDWYSFDYCENLKTVTVSKGIRNIDYYAVFNCCESLEKFILRERLTEIKNCPSSVTIEYPRAKSLREQMQERSN